MIHVLQRFSPPSSIKESERRKREVFRGKGGWIQVCVFFPEHEGIEIETRGVHGSADKGSPEGNVHG